MPKKKSPPKKSSSRVPRQNSPKKQKVGRRGASSSEPFLIVGIGASAGGLEALEELLENLPADTGMAFVVVTHQHPGYKSLLPELLSKETDMVVIEAEDGTRLEPNHVYVGLAGGHLEILNGTLYRMEDEKKAGARLPVDSFFRSLAQDQKERAICIILSGTGTDGTLGVSAIKGESGMAMVQQPQSAKYSGMPSSAIATGLVDYVLHPKAMPKQLVAYARGPYLTGREVASLAPSIPAEPVQKIFMLLRSRTGNDFSGYKSNTIRRRIERRMNLHQITKHDHYVRYLQENPHEIDILFKELLISVTCFFRDPEAWEIITPEIEKLLDSRPADYAFRIWIPGCATGEEAYSVAIVLHECMQRAKQPFDVQIFGTDLDSDAIETARNGQYPEGIARDLTPERLERYFTRDDSIYRVRKEIREMVIFAQQNVIKDPPFTKLDMISCRNLLIYLDSELQQKLLPIFHYSLKPEGLLFLGPSETIAPFNDLFGFVDKRWKIFRRKENPNPSRPLPEIPAQTLAADVGDRLLVADPPTTKASPVSSVIERLLLGRFTPACIVVNNLGDIIYIHGRTGRYLEPTQGQPRANILEMAREGLQIELVSAMRRCAADGDEVTSERVRVKTDEGFTDVDLSVSKLNDPESLRGLLLVTFRPLAPSEPDTPAKSKKRPAKAGRSDRYAQLESELQFTKESHRTTLEELETSNEELQSTNEEIQSTNEELETSKEEMQSLNEELTTVNAELQSKLDDLSQANDDMQNLLNSTDIATVFLDNDLNIKRFTEQAQELISLRQMDVGRPISELASKLEHAELAGDCQRVLKTLIFIENSVRTEDGAWFQMRIMPYRTADNVIDGLVLTFVDINRLRETERKMRQLSMVFMDALDPIIIVSLENHVIDVNHEAERTFGYARSEMLDKPLMKFLPDLERSEKGELLKRCLERGAIHQEECTRVHKSGEASTVRLTLTLLTDEDGNPDAIAMTTKHTKDN